MKVRVTFDVDSEVMEALRHHNGATGREGFTTWAQSVVRTTLDDIVYEHKNDKALVREDGRDE